MLNSVSLSLFSLLIRMKNDLEKGQGIKILHVLTDPQSVCYCLKYLK